MRHPFIVCVTRLYNVGKSNFSQATSVVLLLVSLVVLVLLLLQHCSVVLVLMLLWCIVAMVMMFHFTSVKFNYIIITFICSTI